MPSLSVSVRSGPTGSSDAARREGEADEASDRLRPVVVETRRGIEQFQRIREALARLEFTDGLSFARLVIEVTPRLPRDATVIAILPASISGRPSSPSAT